MEASGWGVAQGRGATGGEPVHKIGDAYFVEDGNHRVSVSRYQGIEMIDAEVTQFGARSSAGLKVPDLELAVAY